MPGSRGLKRLSQGKIILKRDSRMSKRSPSEGSAAWPTEGWGSVLPLWRGRILLRPTPGRCRGGESDEQHREIQEGKRRV